VLVDRFSDQPLGGVEVHASVRAPSRDGGVQDDLPGNVVYIDEKGEFQCYGS